LSFLPVCERVLGVDDVDTLTVRASLAAGWSRGDAATARRMSPTAARLPTIRGNDHLDTLTVRARLATATGQSGDPATARDQYAGSRQTGRGFSGLITPIP